jgi:glycosyltransferase involved in cell wall biosynthesis
MIVLFQRSLGPYRVSLFNCLSDVLDGDFTLVLTRPDRTPNRRWTIPWSEVRCRVVVLPGHRLDIGRGTLEVSRGVGAALAELKPQAIVLAGWDVHACWTTLRWARQRGVPLVGWVESSERTGQHRGVISNSIRRRFLRACSAAIVPGASSEAFVRLLAPGLPCHRAPNSVDAPDLRAIGQTSPAGAAVFIGELSARKGADLVLAAAPEILQLFPRVILAGDGPLRSDAIALAAKLPGLEYAGFVEGPEKTRLYEESAIILIPSRMDPWPLVACEALVGLRPIVVGPGVGSLLDLRHLAGEAVCAMAADTPQDLIDAASQARGQVVPRALRAAFRPEAVAAAMAAAALSVTPGGEPLA